MKVRHRGGGVEPLECETAGISTTSFRAIKDCGRRSKPETCAIQQGIRRKLFNSIQVSALLRDEYSSCTIRE